MTPEEMAKDAAKAMQAKTNVTLVLPHGWKRPPKFPRGELLCENADGRNVYSFDPVAVLAWLCGNGLVDIDIIEIPGSTSGFIRVRAPLK